MVATDLGFAKQGRNYAADIDLPVACIEKRRQGNNAATEALTLLGGVKDRDVIRVDDEVNTVRCKTGFCGLAGRDAREGERRVRRGSHLRASHSLA